MLSPSSADDEPTTIRRIMQDFSSKMGSESSTKLCKQKLSFSQSVLSDEEESFLSEKRSRFHDPLSSSIGRKRFASERAREVSSLEEENASLKSQLEKLRSEHISAKSSISKMKSLQRSGEVSYQRLLLEAQGEAKGVRSKYEKEQVSVKALKEELTAAQSRQKEENKDGGGELSKLKKTLSSYERSVSELRQEVFKGKKALESSNEQRNNLRIKLESETASLGHQVAMLELQRREWEEKKALEEKRVLQIGRQEGEIESLKGDILKKDLELGELREELLQNKEAVLQRTALRSVLSEHPRLLKKVEALTKENGLLLKTQENVELLKEKMSGYEEELSRNRELVSSSLQSSHELLRLQKVLKAWESVVRRVFLRGAEEETVGPEFLSIKLAELQRNELLLRNNLGEAQTDKKMAESRIQSLEETLRQGKNDKEKMDEFAGDQAKKVKKLQRKLLLLAKERDSYKSLLESYEHEVTFAGGQIEKDKISMLEGVISDHKEMISKMEDQLDTREVPITIGLPPPPPAKNEETAALKKDLEAALNERDHLRYELENRAIKGDYNPHNTRVIQFKNNPMAEASENVGSKITKLQEENQSLKVRIKLMEEGQMKDLTLLSNQKVDEGISPKEVEELRNKAKSSEKKNERLMEAFKKTSKDFRKMTQELTGYRINSDGGESDFYRVTSIYTDSPDLEQLLFQRDEKGVLLLLQNNYAESLGDLIKIHLNSQDSIPAFLAGLTLDLISKQQSFEASTDDVNEDEPICID